MSRTSALRNQSPAAAAGRRGRGERGTALVEFAIILPLLALVSLGTVDLGRAYMTVNQVKNAAREGAVYAQTHPARLAGTACTTPDSAQWYARNEAGSAGAGFAVQVSTPAGTFTSSDIGCAPLSAAATSGQDVTVVVSTPFAVLTPLVRAVTGNPTIRASVTVRVQ
jgi:Flp pilus assembly protein TadG